MLALAILASGCSRLPVETHPGPEYSLAKEEPLGASGELVLELYKVRPELEDAYESEATVYSYWISEASNRLHRTFLRKSRYDGLPFHASDDLRFLVMDHTLMAGISDVEVWRRVQGTLYRRVDAGLGWDKAFDYYLKEWKAEHSGLEDKDLPLPDRGAQVQVRFVRWTKPNREVLLSLSSQYGGAGAKEFIDHWYFLYDLETLRPSRDLTGVELPRKAPRENQDDESKGE